eukprot:scaffold157944_cov30-Attheya_sp.AAC.1
MTTTTVNKENENVDNKMNSLISTLEAVKVVDDDELVNLRRQNSELKGLVLRALKEQIRLNDMKLEDFSKDLQDDPEFFLAVCNWYDLPKRWKDDAAIACATLNTQCM